MRRITPIELKARRIALGLGQGDLAMWLGVKQATVSNWERGAHAIPEGINDEINDLEQRFMNLLDKYLTIVGDVLEADTNVSIMTHSDPGQFFKAHPEMGGVPLAMHQVAAAHARMMLSEEHGVDVPIYDASRMYE